MKSGGHKIAGVDVPGAGDDLNRLVPADVYAAYPHMVGVGVPFQGEYPADKYIVDLRAEILICLDLGAGEGHGLCKFAVVYIADGNAVNKLCEPFSA